jgi:plastocyanin
VISVSSALRGSALPFIAAIALVLAACSSTTPSDNSGGGTVAVVDGAVTITAAGLEFDANVIEAPAGEGFTITLVNSDSVPHNISVYTEEGGTSISEGTIINGGETTQIEVEALEAGEYFWVCDLHPDMNGALVVEA